jgi:hypothetical protein
MKKIILASMAAATLLFSQFVLAQPSRVQASHCVAPVSNATSKVVENTPGFVSPGTIVALGNCQNHP